MIRSHLDDRETGAKVRRHDRDHRLRNGQSSQRSESRRGRRPQGRGDCGPAIAASGQPCDSARRRRIRRRHGRASPHRAWRRRSSRLCAPASLAWAFAWDFSSCSIRSSEDGEHTGLGSAAREGGPVRPQAWPEDSPHGLEQPARLRPVPLLKDVGPEPSVYFVHSYHAVPDVAADIAAVADYPDPFAAIVWRDNLMACQFHPEKSQRVGLAMYANFAACESALNQPFVSTIKWPIGSTALGLAMPWPRDTLRFVEGPLSFW